ncbi:hypothetical protein EGW08_006410, partial [Elysia chlorotica]
ECTENTYGVNCEKYCSHFCGGVNKTCSPVSGECLSGCVTGYQGLLCDQAIVTGGDTSGEPDGDTECANNKYGVNCSKSCSPNCAGADKQCYHTNGSCVLGCESGYSGPKCDIGVKDAVSEYPVITVLATSMLVLISLLLVLTV